MLEKTMLKIFKKKVDSWLKSIDNEEVKEAIREDLIITGGCFVSLINNEMPNDFDCYFRTKETVLKVANYYVDKWNEEHKDQKNKVGYETKVFVFDNDNPSKELLEFYKCGNLEELKQSKAVIVNNIIEGRVKIVFPSDGVVSESKDEEKIDFNEIIGGLDEIPLDDLKEVKTKGKEPYKPVFMSSNAITLNNDIQIVVRFYGEPDVIHKNYDFLHTKAYYDHKYNKIDIPKEVYEAIINKTLFYTGSKYPLCSMFRLRKFIQRGWKINAGEMLKIAFQISELDLTDVNILEEQLIGVDTLYFKSLIDMLKEEKIEDITKEYIYTIIDKIF